MPSSARESCATGRGSRTLIEQQRLVAVYLVWGINTREFQRVYGCMYGSWAGHLCYYRSYFHWIGALIVYSYVIIVVPVKPRGTHFVPHASETPHRSCVKLLKITELSTVYPKGLGYRTYRMHRTRARQEDTSNGSIQKSNPSHPDNTRCNHSSSRSWGRSSSGIRWVDVIVTYGLVFESCLGLELFHPTYILYYRQNYEQLHQTIRIRDL